MDFEHSPRARELLERLDAFIEREVVPREEPYHRELLRAPTRGSCIRRSRI